MFDGLSKKSYWWYLPIVTVLLFGYFLGGLLTFGIHYLGLFPIISNESARQTLVLFGMGVLGATLYTTKWWAIDIDEAIDKPAVLPHLFDAFGYSTTIIGGGITGVVLYLLTRAGVGLVLAKTEVPEVRFSASLVIAFCGGLFHFMILSKLEDYVRKALKKV